MLTTIVNIQPKDSGGGGGETRETIVHRLASEMEEKLPPDYIPFEVSLRLDAKRKISCNFYKAVYIVFMDVTCTVFSLDDYVMPATIVTNHLLSVVSRRRC